MDPSLEPATLEGGLSKNGKPAELVILQGGKPISLATGKPYEADVAGPIKRTITLDDAVDEGVERSMARRKKDAPPMNINQKCADCDKVFKRPCDLTYVVLFVNDLILNLFANLSTESTRRRTLAPGSVNLLTAIITLKVGLLKKSVIVT